MRYLGGKSRIAARLASLIAPLHKPGMSYLAPFVGAGSVLVAMTKVLPPDTPLAAYDIHEDLILLWQALQQGWQPPAELDEPTYQRLKREAPSALRGFAGFGCAFGGDWFHGYARNTRKDRYAEQSRNSLLAKIKYLDRVVFTCAAYCTLAPQCTLIYCDPPYNNRAGYRDTFDHTAFWQRVREWSATNTVVVSEYSAPTDFRVFASFERNQELRTGGTVRELVAEKLFIHESLPIQ
jgi:DNA adenine methylase